MTEKTQSFYLTNEDYRERHLNNVKDKYEPKKFVCQFCDKSRFPSSRTREDSNVCKDCDKVVKRFIESAYLK